MRSSDTNCAAASEEGRRWENPELLKKKECSFLFNRIQQIILDKLKKWVKVILLIGQDQFSFYIN
jgi:hypothetical protein